MTAPSHGVGRSNFKFKTDMNDSVSSEIKDNHAIREVQIVLRSPYLEAPCRRAATGSDNVTRARISKQCVTFDHKEFSMDVFTQVCLVNSRV